MTTKIEEYRFETISSWDQQLAQSICNKQAAAPLTLGFETGEMAFSFSPGKKRGVRQAHVSWAVGERGTIGVVFDDKKGLYALLGAQAQESPIFGMDLEILPEPVFWALCEAILAPVTSWLGRLTGEPVQLAEPGIIPASDAIVEFTFTCGSRARVTGAIGLFHDRHLFDAVASAAAGFPPRLLPMGSMEALQVEAAFALGEVSLPLEQLRGLDQGDLLIPDRWFYSQNQGMLTVSPFSFAFALNPETHEIALLEKGVKRVDTPIENSLDNIEDLEIKVVFEIERRTMPVKSVRTLVKDSLIPLGALPEQGLGVDIVAGGKCIAKGKVVNLGQTLGIQVTDTGKPADTAGPERPAPTQDPA